MFAVNSAYLSIHRFQKQANQRCFHFILFSPENKFENMEIQFVRLCCRRKERIMHVAHFSDRYGF